MANLTEGIAICKLPEQHGCELRSEGEAFGVLYRFVLFHNPVKFVFLHREEDLCKTAGRLHQSSLRWF